MLLILKLVVLWFSLVQALFFYENGQQRFIPLKTLNVNGEFFDNLGEVVLRQTWHNDRGVPITSKYKFSLDSNAVVSGLQLKIGNHSWIGMVKAKDEAKAEFNEAVASGVKSSLLEKISDTDYHVEIGPIGPSETAEVEFSYLIRTPVTSDGSYRFTLPTNIAPKYTSSKTVNQADIEYAKTMGSIPYMSQPAYTFEVDLLWRSGSALREIVSPTNAIETVVLDSRTFRVNCVTTPENGDFSLLVKTAETTGAYVYEKADGTSILYIHNQIPTETVTSTDVKKITIVLDRSGSMSGNKMVQAKAAVDHFLSLIASSESTYVNIYSFGNSFKSMFPEHVVATEVNIQTMRQRVRDFHADMGGTELYECLRAVMISDRKHDEVDHVIVLLTDGQVSNLNSVVNLLDQKPGFRVMTVGIGNDADRKLVQQIADKTNGICRFLVDEVDITSALIEIMHYSNKQYYTDLRMLGYDNVIQGSKVLYPTLPVDFFIHLTAEQFSEVQRRGLTITAFDPVNSTPKVWNLAVTDLVRTDNLLEKLYANHVINNMIDKLETYNQGNRNEVDAEIVRLSVLHGIMNKRTSFIVISDDVLGEEDLKNVQSLEVPHHSNLNLNLNRQAGQVPGSWNSPRSFAQAAFKHTSGTPSTVPSTIPTRRPTCQPTGQPTSEPSSALSAMPTCCPSAQPTAGSKVLPNAMSSLSQPTMPSSVPSVAPLVAPSGVPSMTPSVSPSTLPSLSPTAVPLVAPTLTPTTAPSTITFAQTAHVEYSFPCTRNLVLDLSFLNKRPLRDMILADSMLYNSESYKLLSYYSQELLEGDAAYVKLQPDLYFNMLVWLFLDAEMKNGQLHMPVEFINQLGLYVQKYVDKSILSSIISTFEIYVISSQKLVKIEQHTEL